MTDRLAELGLVTPAEAAASASASPPPAPAETYPNPPPGSPIPQATWDGIPQVARKAVWETAQGGAGGQTAPINPPEIASAPPPPPAPPPQPNPPAVAEAPPAPATIPAPPPEAAPPEPVAPAKSKRQRRTDAEIIRDTAADLIKQALEHPSMRPDLAIHAVIAATQMRQATKRKGKKDDQAEE